MASPLDLRVTVPADRARFLVGTALTGQGFTVEPLAEGLRATRGSMGATVAVGALSGDSMHVAFTLIVTPTPTGTHIAVDQSDFGKFVKGGVIGTAKTNDVVQDAMHRLGTTLAEQGVLEGAVPSPVVYEGRTNIVAIFALVLGFLVPIGGIVAGIIGLGQVKRTGEKGKGLAIAGIAVGSALTLLYAALIVVALVALPLLAASSQGSVELDPVPDSQGEVPVPDEDPLAVPQFTQGECIDDGAAGLETSVCAEPHDYEVYSVTAISGDVYPGDETVEAQSDEVCAAAFETFVGIPFPDSSLTYSYVAPIAETWEIGDRQIACVVFDPTGQTTGSLAGAAR